ncbi:Uma2 family endonuclease [Streptomyces sp. T-3]|nr:Uma2 family endonuclease [Streptomyces sp. T-3]
MSALTVSHESDRSWDELVQYWEDMEWPEGSKVEIIEGLITVTPSPANQHNGIADWVQRRLYSVIPEDWGIFQTLAIAVPSRLGMFIPDLVVAPRSYVDSPGTHIPAGAAELVVEITSKSNATHDRITKAEAYAAAGIPLYLLVDRWASGGPTVTLYGEPASGPYRVLHAGKFGDVVRLPQPFDLGLDTSAFTVD